VLPADTNTSQIFGGGSASSTDVTSMQNRIANLEAQVAALQQAQAKP
jgi:hypothetical protein